MTTINSLDTKTLQPRFNLMTSWTGVSWTLCPWATRLYLLKYTSMSSIAVLLFSILSVLLITIINKLFLLSHLSLSCNIIDFLATFGKIGFFFFLAIDTTRWLLQFHRKFEKSSVCLILGIVKRERPTGLACCVRPFKKIQYVFSTGFQKYCTLTVSPYQVHKKIKKLSVYVNLIVPI